MQRRKFLTTTLSSAITAMTTPAAANGFRQRTFLLVNDIDSTLDYPSPYQLGTIQCKELLEMRDALLQLKTNDEYAEEWVNKFYQDYKARLKDAQKRYDVVLAKSKYDPNRTAEVDFQLKMSVAETAISYALIGVGLFGASLLGAKAAVVVSVAGALTLGGSVVYQLFSRADSNSTLFNTSIFMVDAKYTYFAAVGEFTGDKILREASSLAGTPMAIASAILSTYASYKLWKQDDAHELLHANHQRLIEIMNKTKTTLNTAFSSKDTFKSHMRAQTDEAIKAVEYLWQMIAINGCAVNNTLPLSAFLAMKNNQSYRLS